MKINTALEDSNNNAGSSSKSIVKQVAETNIPESIIMDVPIYVGDENQKITVDLVVTIFEKDINISLESAELAEFSLENATKHLQEKIKEYRELGYPVIVG